MNKKDGKKEEKKEDKAASTNKPASKNSYKSLLMMDREVSKKPKPKNDSTSTRVIKKAKRSRSRSPRREVKRKIPAVVIVDYDVPDKSFGDFYCKPCDAHMNSEPMWEAHLQGKRHMKHAKKGEQAEQKFEYVDELPLVQPEIDAVVTDPIVGLHHVCEIQRLEQKPMYNCFLCSANLPTTTQLLEHLTGIKHYMAFLKEHDTERYQVISSADLKKFHLESLVKEVVVKIQCDLGPTRMQVKREKEKSGYSSAPNYSKKPYRDDSESYPRYGETNRNRRPNSPWRRLSPYSDRSDDYYPPEREVPAAYRDDYYVAREKEREKEREEREREKERERETERERERERQREKERDNMLTRERIEEKESYSRRPSYQPSTQKSAPTERSFYEDKSNTSWANIDDRQRCTDLREVLEQKKAQDSHRSDSFASSTATNPISSFDDLLSLISTIPKMTFYKLSIFKVDGITIDDEAEVKVMELLLSKFTSKIMDFRSRRQPPDLKAKFQQSMIQNGIAPDNPRQIYEDSDESVLQMLEQMKNRKTVSESVTPMQYAGANSYAYQGMTNYSSVGATQRADTAGTSRRIDSVYGTRDTPVWNPTQSNPQPVLSFTSSPSSIPGLTLTDEASPPASYPSTTKQSILGLDQLASRANSILSSLPRGDQYAAGRSASGSGQNRPSDSNPILSSLQRGDQYAAGRSASGSGQNRPSVHQQVDQFFSEISPPKNDPYANSNRSQRW